MLPDDVTDHDLKFQASLGGSNFDFPSVKTLDKDSLGERGDEDYQFLSMVLAVVSVAFLLLCVTVFIVWRR